MTARPSRAPSLSLRLAAVAIITIGCRSAPALSPQMEATAIGLEAKGDWHGLAAFAKQATQQYPNDGEAWFYAAAAAQGLGETTAARKDLQNVERCGPVALRTMAQSMLAQLQPQPDSARPQPTANIQPSSLPEISPASIAAQTAQVRRSWQPDAIPFTAIVTGGEGAYATVVNYYSPSTRHGLSVRQGANGSGMQRVDQPDYVTTPLPQSFKSLADAVAVARTRGLSGALDHAFLYWADDIPSPDNLVWDMAFGIRSDAARVIANDLSQSRIQKLLAAANAGNPSAQYALGTAYQSGVGVKEDPQKSVYWLQMAAAQGDHPAQNKLGQDFQTGYGVTADPQRAALWYSKAAAAGFGPAEYNLGLLYENGVGVERNWDYAQHWFNLAERQGVQQSALELDEMQSAQARASGGATPAQIRAADALADRIARSGCPLAQHPVLAINPATTNSVYCVDQGPQWAPTGTPQTYSLGPPAGLQLEGLPSWYKFYRCSLSPWNVYTGRITVSCTR